MPKLTCPDCGYGMAMRVTTCAHCRKIAKKLAEIVRRDMESA
jgi:predicted RNA-binding Zn-ribbon protein involved in translation (DUF1610 family)